MQEDVDIDKYLTMYVCIFQKKTETQARFQSNLEKILIHWKSCCIYMRVEGRGLKL